MSDCLSAVIFYDSPEAGQRAVDHLRRVARRIGDDCDLHIWLWRLDVIKEAALGRKAWPDLKRAEVVVLALEDEGSLDQAARERLTEMLRVLHGQEVAVALLRKEGATSAAGIDFLHEAADQAGVEFLTSIKSGPSSGGVGLLSALQCRATSTTQLLEGILTASHPPSSRWGWF